MASRILIRIERELNRVAPSGVEIAIPYWPWSDANATNDHMLQDNRFGNTLPDTGYQPVTTGFFAKNAPTGVDRPDWWPDGVPGWHVRDEFQTKNTQPDFKNNIYRQVRSVNHLPDDKDIEFGLSRPNYHWFWRWLEEGEKTHNSMHGWIGGNLSNALFSPVDPIFLLNHANVDRLWAQWQEDGHEGVQHYPDQAHWAGQPTPAEGEKARKPIPIGHKLNDSMWPWVGTAKGYATNMSDILSLPYLAAWAGDYSDEPPRHPVDVLDTTNTGKPTEAYIYQESTVRFPAVKNVLDAAINKWTLTHGDPPDFSGHGPNFGWQSAQQLRNSQPKGLPLIEANLIGIGRAEETNLIKILRVGLPGFGPRMPKNGPFLSSAEIHLIAKWINDGCLP